MHHTTGSLTAGSGFHIFVVKITPDGLETNTANNNSSNTGITVAMIMERG